MCLMSIEQRLCEDEIFKFQSVSYDVIGIHKELQFRTLENLVWP